MLGNRKFYYFSLFLKSECPVVYFKCQIINDGGDGYRGAKFVAIPPRNGGNKNLVKTDKGWIANSDDTQDCEDQEERKLWKWLKFHATKRISNYFKTRYKKDGLAKVEGMCDGQECLNI